MVNPHVKTADVVAVFKAINIDISQLRALAPTVAWDKPTIEEAVAIKLRDAWRKCRLGQPRVEAFWAWGGSEETPKK